MTMPSNDIILTYGKQSTKTVVSTELETKVVVDRIELASEGVVALTLRDQAGNPLPAWTPGAHVDLILPNEQFKQYSLCGSPQDRMTWRLGILRNDEGSGASTYVHTQLAVGDVLTARGPRNHFPLVDASEYVFVAGGIGITPILAMIRQADSQGKPWRLFYGGRTRASLAFLDELSGYGDRTVVWPQDQRGFLPINDILSTLAPTGLAYCCGPAPLLDAMELAAQSLAPRRLRVERFAAKTIDDSNDTAIEVELDLSGLTLQVPAHESILSVVRKAGISTVSSCGEGICGTCETAVLAGVPEHRDSVLNEDERELGDSMMICVSRSRTPRLVLDL